MFTWRVAFSPSWKLNNSHSTQTLNLHCLAKRELPPDTCSWWYDASRRGYASAYQAKTILRSHVCEGHQAHHKHNSLHPGWRLLGWIQSNNTQCQMLPYPVPRTHQLSQKLGLRGHGAIRMAGKVSEFFGLQRRGNTAISQQGDSVTWTERSEREPSQEPRS
jgi:hypothetical protein